MIERNIHARRAAYPDDLRALLTVDRARECGRWLAAWDMIAAPTPLRPLPGLAARLGIATVAVKDESVRSPLGSFKALGAPAALIRLVLRKVPAARPESVLAGAYRAALRDLVVISATDGNHGRALAAAARSAGCRCAIVLHALVSGEREAAIADCGAQVIRIAGNYDESVREAARLAQRHGWQLVSDTAWPGYEEIPRDVMQGYAVAADEVFEQEPQRFTHVVVQGGVGGLAAAAASVWWERCGAQRPQFVVVEPEQADCLLQSARAGGPSIAAGSIDSVMAGLACGAASPLAWRFLQPAVDTFVTVSDAQAIAAVRLLARGSDDDVPVLAGESGAAGLAALLAYDPRELGLDARSRVLLFNTEGATAPALYQSLTGRTPAAVLDAQARWLAAR